jgi:hypothetical protein
MAFYESLGKGGTTMTTGASTKKMLPLQLPMTTYEKLTALGAAEKINVTQVVRTILDKALNLKDGNASLQDIYAVFSHGEDNRQRATQPSRPLRVSVLKR